MLHRLPVIHGIEVEAGIVGLDGLEESPESILQATFGQRRKRYGILWRVRRTTFDLFSVAGSLFRPFQCRPSVVVRAWVWSVDGEGSIGWADVDMSVAGEGGLRAVG